MSLIQRIALILTVIGAINWGLIGLLSINLVSILVAGSVILQRLVFCSSYRFNTISF